MRSTNTDFEENRAQRERELSKVEHMLPELVQLMAALKAGA